MTRASDDQNGNGTRIDPVRSGRTGSEAQVDPTQFCVDIDWRDRTAYAYLDGADRRMFGWEWLRRCRPYRESWRRHHRRPTDRPAIRAARNFALVALVDPQIDARHARPVWTTEQDTRCLNAAARSPQRDDDLFDISKLSTCASVTVDQDGDEHWSFSDGRWLLRLDIVDGTLLGGPADLSFRIAGLARLNPQIDPLLTLAHLVAERMRAPPRVPHVRTERWISELRTADALDQGATHRMIGEALFGAEHAIDWRRDSDAYRLRVQRLTRVARARRTSWTAAEWLG